MTWTASRPPSRICASIGWIVAALLIFYSGFASAEGGDFAVPVVEEDEEVEAPPPAPAPIAGIGVAVFLISLLAGMDLPSQGEVFIGDQDLNLLDEDGRARLRAGRVGFVNIFARRQGSDPDLYPVAVGSHLDTQPTGGRFDGVYGVLTGWDF